MFIALYVTLVFFSLCVVVPVPGFSVDLKIITSHWTECVLVVQLIRRGPSLSLALNLAQINRRRLLVPQVQIESQWRKGGVAVGGAFQEPVRDLQSDLTRSLVQLHHQHWYDL